MNHHEAHSSINCIYALKAAIKIDDLKPYNVNNNILHCEMSASLMAKCSTKYHNKCIYSGKKPP